MSVNPVMITLQTTALKELNKFTGDPSQKVTQFINAIEHIGTFSAMNDSMLHSLATIKLGGAAFNWYDNNKETLTSWPSLKTHLVDRFKPSLSAAKTQLKERNQQPGEPLLAYYDDVVDLCKQVDNEMPLHMIVDYLQDGLRDELKIHVKRHMRTLNDALTPAIFLKIARNEEELQQEISSTHQPSIVPSQPYFARLTAVTSQYFPPHQNPIRTPRTSDVRPPRSPIYSHPSPSPHPRPLMLSPSHHPCLICNQSNHRTIDCHFKQPSGCYKCGVHGHTVSRCPQVFQ